MSAGTRVYTVRLPAALMHEVNWTIQRRNVWTAAEPWTISDFIRVALEREIRKMMRSRKRQRKNLQVKS